MKNHNHLMIDLETLGTGNNSAILSIGAVEFDITTGDSGRFFYQKIDLQTCLDVGLNINGATFYWWLTQSEDARLELLKDRHDLRRVLEEFSVFISNNETTYQVWGNGSTFDLTILGNAYDKLNMTVPWYFRDIRDVRTIVSFAPEIKENATFKGTAHKPLDDSLHQIKYLHETCLKIFK